MSTARPFPWGPVVAAGIAAVGVAAIGGSVTDLGPWYQSLKEPAWKPPDAAFGLIWTVIFACAAASAAVAWHNGRRPAQRQQVVGLFAANGLLNIVWTLLFFQVKRPDLALAEVALLWLSILVLIVILYRRSRLASMLLVPYLVWVSIAAALNYQVVALNGPFS
jgi:tryptophan-rich sensory protein